MKHGGLLTKHKSEFFFQISQKLSISTFPIISVWELLVAIATRVLIRPENKNTSSVEANVLSMYAMFRLHPPYGF